MRFIILFMLFSVTIFSQEKKVSEIVISNTKKMNSDFILKIIETKVGSSLDSLKVERDIVILTRLNGVSKVEYQIDLLNDSNYKLTLNFIESYTIIPLLNIWTTDGFGSYRLGLYEYNFLGRNTVLGGYYQYNEFHSYGVNFSSPSLFSANVGAEANFQKWNSKEPVFINSNKANYQYTNTSLEVLGIYKFNFQNIIKFGVSFFNEKYNYIDGATATNIPQNLDVNKQLYKFQYTFDNLKYDYFKIDGLKSNLYLQYVVSQNNFQDKFVIGWNDLMYYKLVGVNGNWASRLRLGLASNSKSPFAPFAVDNNINLRGVGNIIDRGTGTVVLNSEYRHTLFEKNKLAIQGNLFVDAGTWRSPGGNLEDLFSSKNIKVYPGFGIRFIHKKIYNAVFRIDYGYGITKNANNGIVFGIGQYF
jgi:hypothetical protein